MTRHQNPAPDDDYVLSLSKEVTYFSNLFTDAVVARNHKQKFAITLLSNLFSVLKALSKFSIIQGSLCRDFLLFKLSSSLFKGSINMTGITMRY